MTDPERSPDPHDRSPPSSDPGWVDRCAPLLSFLATPRPWSELSSWATERSVAVSQLRNMLAWLDCEHLATSFRRQGSWMWCRATQRGVVPRRGSQGVS